MLFGHGGPHLSLLLPYAAKLLSPPFVFILLLTSHNYIMALKRFSQFWVDNARLLTTTMAREMPCNKKPSSKTKWSRWSATKAGTIEAAKDGKSLISCWVIIQEKWSLCVFSLARWHFSERYIAESLIYDWHFSDQKLPIKPDLKSQRSNRASYSCRQSKNG